MGRKNPPVWKMADSLQVNAIYSISLQENSSCGSLWPVKWQRFPNIIHYPHI